MKLKTIIKDNVIFFAILAFGVLSFLGGNLFSNLQFKNKDQARRLQTSESEDKAYSTLFELANGTALSVSLLRGLINTYSGDYQDSEIQTSAVKQYLERSITMIQNIETRRRMGEIAVKDACGHLSEELPQRKAIELFYNISEEINELTPGILSALQSKPKYAAATVSRLQENRPPIQNNEEAKPARLDVDEQDNSNSQLYSDFVSLTVLKKGMTLSVVERTIGVPLSKEKDGSGYEVWRYSCAREGFQNCIYFKNGALNHWKMQRISSLKQ